MKTSVLFVVGFVVLGSPVGGGVETNPCICNHGDTQDIYAVPDVKGSVVSSLTTGQCIIVYLHTGGGTLFYTVQQDGQLAYIMNEDSLHVESCDSTFQPGSTVTMVTATTTASVEVTTNPVPISQSSSPALEIGCPQGWSHVDNSCYLFTSAVLRNWTHASVFCQQQHGHLVFINSQHEQNSVVDFLQKHFFKDDMTYGVWLGATDQVFEGRWEWSNPDGNNTPLEPGFTFWSHGQPNNNNNQDCAYIEVASHSHWADGQCSDARTVLCESTPKLVNVVIGQTTTAVQPLSTHCDHGWKLFGDQCYLFKVSSSDIVTWTHAKNACEAMGSHLIFIESQAEQNFVSDTLKHLTHATDDLWTGATDKVNEGHWRWMIGHTRYHMTFTAWMHGRPDPSGHEQEDCIVLRGSHDYMWKEASCTRHLNYICESPSSRTVVPIIG